MVLSESLQEILVRLPKNLLNEVDGLMKYDNRDLSDFICQATKNYLEQKKYDHIQQFRESMQKGYEEMARINLTIASEAFQAEEEAENTLERSVIGV
nr:antitoxin [Virgibacillus necropolis]